MQSSSEDLHPTAGARFVFVRDASLLQLGGEDGAEDEDGQDSASIPLTSLRYEVAAHLASGQTLTATLTWDAAGQARLDPSWEDAWAREEALKLARVLKADPKRRLLRWRGPNQGR
jgi:hypothetical protein